MQTVPSSFQSVLHDTSRFLFLYGTTPPRVDAAPERIERAVSRLAARTSGLALDGIIVYDVQDESERMSQPRPFPFLPTLGARTYASLLQRATERTVLCYKSVAQVADGDWQPWLDETHDIYGLRCLSLVWASCFGTVRRRTFTHPSLPGRIASSRWFYSRRSRYS